MCLCPDSFHNAYIIDIFKPLGIDINHGRISVSTIDDAGRAYASSHPASGTSTAVLEKVQWPINPVPSSCCLAVSSSMLHSQLPTSAALQPCRHHKVDDMQQQLPHYNFLLQACREVRPCWLQKTMTEQNISDPTTSVQIIASSECLHVTVECLGCRWLWFCVYEISQCWREKCFEIEATEGPQKPPVGEYLSCMLAVESR